MCSTNFHLRDVQPRPNDLHQHYRFFDILYIQVEHEPHLHVQWIRLSDRKADRDPNATADMSPTIAVRIPFSANFPLHHSLTTRQLPSPAAPSSGP